jgi:hypothetical protein
MLRLLRPLGLTLLALVTLQPSSGQAFDIHCTTPLALTLPVAQQTPLRLFVRGERGTWQPLAATVSDGKMSLTLDPAKLGGSNLTLILNPSPDLVLDDYEPPVIIGIKLDGQPLKIAGHLKLGNVTRVPEELRVGFKESHNQLSTPLQATLNGRPVPLTVKLISPRQALAILNLPTLEYGRHKMQITATDNSPQQNAATAVVSFTYYDPTNLALATSGATTAVSSSFSGYEGLTPLNDGVFELPGDSCGSDLTWASAEVSEDHWAMVILPQPQQLREVTVYWAAYTHGALSPQTFEIQVPEGKGWRAVYRSPEAGEPVSPVTTARFAPLKTDRFRVWMPAGKGPVARPNLLWIAEIQAR